MSTQLPFALGPEQLFYIAVESAWNTYQDWAATDGLAVLGSVFNPTQPREVRKSTRDTRSELERYTMRKSCDWEVKTELMGSGTAGTAPDMAPLLYGLLGTQTTTPATSVAWTPAKTQCPVSLQMGRSVYVGAQHLNGCIVNEATFDFTDIVNCAFKGGNVWQTFNNTVLCDGTTGNNYVDTTASMAKQVDVNSKISVDDGTNSDEGFTVADVNTTTGRITFGVGEVLTADYSDAELLPWRPTPTTAGNPSTALVGSLKFDGGEIAYDSFSLTISNNLKMHNGRWGYDRATYGFFLRRAVTFSVGIPWRRDMGVWYDVARRFTDQVSVSLICGSDTAGGDRWTFAMPYCELDVVPLTIPDPDQEEGVISFTGRAMASSSGEDEISITND
jgi:hypothetical protein